MKLTSESLKLFLSLVADAGNWGDTPMIDITPAERGNLTQLKKAGLLTTSESDGIMWAHFTAEGAKLAAASGYPDLTVTAK